MLTSFNLRDISREAASAACHFPINTIDQLVHRFDIGGKNGSSRLFSIRDLVTITTARNLSGNGLSISEALRLVSPLLDDEPPPDTVVIVTADGDAWLQPQSADWPECNCRVVAVGRLTKDITEALNGLVH